MTESRHRLDKVCTVIAENSTVFQLLLAVEETDEAWRADVGIR